MLVQANDLKDKITAMMLKVAAKTVSREEGALYLNDLMRRSMDKSKLQRVLLELGQSPPSLVLAKTVFHVISLTNNVAFVEILEAGLKHKDEEVCIFSAEGLARYKNDRARDMLLRHLVDDLYHIRKTSAKVLVTWWGSEGIRLVVAHGLHHHDLYIRDTAASVLADAGAPGLSALLEVIESDNADAIQSAIEALIPFWGRLKKEHVPKLIRALETAIISRQSTTIIAILRLLALLKGLLSGFEEYLAILLNETYEPVRQAASQTLKAVGTERAHMLLSDGRTLTTRTGFLTDDPG
ncbi:MAG TPA: HEAT repeat domain-containing protein [Nitrospirota bacterium]|nr:HEAT repeat domain-containing protein [Nitrospirota bacterium]